MVDDDADALDDNGAAPDDSMEWNDISAPNDRDIVVDQRALAAQASEHDDYNVEPLMRLSPGRLVENMTERQFFEHFLPKTWIRRLCRHQRHLLDGAHDSESLRVAALCGASIIRRLRLPNGSQDVCTTAASYKKHLAQRPARYHGRWLYRPLRCGSFFVSACVRVHSGVRSEEAVHVLRFTVPILFCHAWCRLTCAFEGCSQ